MDTIISRPESTTAAAATTSRPACDFTEPERCRVRALDKAQEYDKENVPPPNLLRLAVGASKGSLAATGKRKRVPLQDITHMYASDRNFQQSVRFFR
ncbi:g2947 [Coccomyxa elongata]